MAPHVASTATPAGQSKVRSAAFPAPLGATAGQPQTKVAGFSAPNAHDSDGDPALTSDSGAEHTARHDSP